MGLARVAWILGLALWVGACGGSADVTNGSKDGGGVGGNGEGGEGPGDGTGGILIDTPGDKADNCTPKTCEELGANCGIVADGCGDVIDCGTCSSGLPCGAFEPNVCATAEDYQELCQRISKEEACAGKECGVEGDGCGGYYDCGTCGPDQTCGLEAPFQCGDNPVFTDEECPARIESCAEVGVTCGVIGNGCGDGTLDCDAELGGCGDGEFCGLGGPNQCGATPTCDSLAPEVACAGKCGIVSDGCSSTIDCTALFPCPEGETCGGGGENNKCGSGAGKCQPIPQEQACGSRTCGMVGDGCDGTYSCGDNDGDCGDGEVCRNGTCEPACRPLAPEDACADKECGMASDGCGNTINCGGCGQYEQCGFLEPFTCDLNPELVPPGACQPLEAAEACAGKQCGIVFDGCGSDVENQIDCSVENGGCGAGEFCGLNAPFQCDAPEEDPCVPEHDETTCNGWACGVAVNNCGEPVDCGTCAGAQTCMGIPAQCVGPTCEVCGAIPSCPADQLTELTGRVITPGHQEDNQVGVPNAFVYILRTTNVNDLPAFTDGVPTNGTACDRCGEQDLGPVLASAVTKPDGTFSLRGNIPVDQDFLLVVKAGKFRRAQMWRLDSNAACTTTQLPTDMPNNPTRLPQHRNDGLAVNIPRIAISTGVIDAMECVFYKMGIAQSEMTRPQENGRIHLYRANGVWPDQVSSNCNSASNSIAIRSACPGCENCSNSNSCTNCKTNFIDGFNHSLLYGTERRINDYDMTVFDCEGGSWDSSFSRDSRRVREYVNRGGRVFASHLSFSWLHPNADKSSNGNTPYDPNTPISTGLGPASTWTTDFNPLYESGIGQITFSHFFNPWPWSPAQPSPRIQNFADWMEAEEITSSDDDYTFDLIEPRSMSTGPGQYSEVFVWATNTNSRVQQFSFNTPYGAPPEASCGRVAYSGFHVSAAGTGNTSPFQGMVFPNHCEGPIGNNGILTDQEKILLYMLFDLGACVGDEPDPPECMPAQCPNDGTCGTRPDGCGGTLDCGCDAGEMCVNGTCEEVTCVPATCAPDQVCMTISDGCGGSVECPCPVCKPVSKEDACAGQCGFVSNGCDGVHQCDEACPPDCEPLTECPAELDCGWISDGCNGTVFCGDCELPAVCGGAGVPNVCGVPECVPLTCEELGAECGYIGDGCGASEFCGACAPGQVCTTVDGVPNQCLGCVPLTCEDVGAECGAIGDGCGGTVNCGSCPAGKVCGAQAPNQCGDGPSCTPRTCEEAGAECGVIGDGCGGTVNCGSCPAGKVCGLETPFRCGDPPPCVKATCESLDAECGLIGDGCGGLLDCGECPSGRVCGAREPNRCSGAIR